MAQGTELRAQGTGQEEGGGERESGKVTSRKLIEKSVKVIKLAVVH